MHDRLTVTAIYGHADGAAVVPALVESLAQLPGSRGLLLSPARPTNLPAGIAWRRIHPLNYVQYSIFVMHGLQHFVDTDYCLIVQEDGWVIRGANFTADYYDYDYVGAPCHAAIIDGQLVTRFQWTRMAPGLVIQNGGFSLRSRRLLEAPSRHGIMYQPDSRAPLGNEDVQLTGTLRPALEAVGMRFAPAEVARAFAVEYLGPGFHDTLDLSSLVGHHARSRRLVAPRRIAVGVARSRVRDVFREDEFLAFLASLGYELEFQQG